MSSKERIRAFIALKTPPSWDEKLTGLQQQLKEKLGGSGKFRWVKAEHLHLTLRFLGHIPPEEAAKAGEAIEEASAGVRPFALSCSGLGCFPRCNAPRILWAGLEDQTGALQRLHQQVLKQTAGIGQAPENRPFKPHLTLARVENFLRSSSSSLSQLLEQSGSVISEPWEVNEILLMRSHLSPQGARYEPIVVQPLDISSPLR